MNCFICTNGFFLKTEYESVACKICKNNGETDSYGSIYFHLECWKKELEDVTNNNEKYRHLRVYTNVGMHEILHHSSVDIV